LGEDLKRQLIFYKLLLDENPTIKGEVQKGILDFVEPTKEKRLRNIWGY